MEGSSESNKSTIIIVDALSYRGSKEEQEIAGIKDVIKKGKDEGHVFNTKSEEFLYGVIKTLLNSRVQDIHLIVYYQNMWRLYQETNDIVNKYFFEFKQNDKNNYNKDNKIITFIIGQTSLFYYLGYMARKAK